MDDLHPPNPSKVYYIHFEWLQTFGPLTEENVLDYFMWSGYYDNQSNNQVLRMQTQHVGAYSAAVEAEELRRFVGIEYVVTHADPPRFFIIQKRHRLSPDEVKPLAVYFVNENRVLQAPSLYSVLSHRLLSSVSLLENTLERLSRARPEYTPRTGFNWPIVVENPEALKKKDGPGEKTDAVTAGDDGVATEPATSQAVTQDSVTAGTQPISSGSQEGLGPPTGPASSQRRQQNTLLLMRAIHTASVHSKVKPPPTGTILAAAAENDETPATSALRSASTPAPSAQEVAIKGINQEAIGKSSGKKRKKKGSMALPSTAAPTPAAS